jgi:hypothetical protein
VDKKPQRKRPVFRKRARVSRILTSGPETDPVGVFLEECAAGKLSPFCIPRQRWWLTLIERTYVRGGCEVWMTDRQLFVFNKIRHEIRYRERMGAYAKAQEPEG